jgi:ribose 1,5-bisphosphate isomerase
MSGLVRYITGQCIRRSVSDIIAETASDIRTMQVRGAGRIARAGASALAIFSESYKGDSLDGFKTDVEAAARILLASRPTAVSLWNGVHASTKDIDLALTMSEARDSVVRNANAFVDMSVKALQAISEIGARTIRNGDVIMTHCNSSAALGVIKKAHDQGKDIKVYATESRPWRQGILTVGELVNAGIDTTLIVDSAVRTVMGRVDVALVGADTIMSNGALVNKIGTSQIALMADEARVRFSVCSETYKFSPMTIFGDEVTIEEREPGEVVSKGEVPDSVKIFNPVFDITPPKYIDGIITELGILSPGSVYDVMIRQFGYRALDSR